MSQAGTDREILGPTWKSNARNLTYTLPSHILVDLIFDQTINGTGCY